MNNLGQYLVELKRFEAASAVLRECLAIRTRKDPDDWRTFLTRSQLGQALVGLQQYSEAEAHLLDAVRGLVARRDTIPPLFLACITDAVNGLVRLYDAWGKPEEAARWRAKLPPELIPVPPRVEP